MRGALPLLLAALAVTAASAQPDSLVTHVSVDGERVGLGDAVGRMAAADVVFLGEQHDDAVAHALQRWLLEAVHARVGAERPVVLGLEMFEFDVQPVLDEYLAGLVEERDVLAAARPWSNYAADYRPLVEYAKANGLPVVATNAPARHVRRVAREGGAEALAALPAASRVGYPPDSLAAGPSPELAAKFAEAMGGTAGHGGGGMLAAQNLRDLSMAWRVAEALRQRPGALVVHVNGGFHSAGGLGIPEHLARLVPAARVLVVTMVPAADADAAPAAPGDVVVRTAAGG